MITVNDFPGPLSDNVSGFGQEFIDLVELLWRNKQKDSVISSPFADKVGVI
jgi:hypothetical protein